MQIDHLSQVERNGSTGKSHLPENWRDLPLDQRKYVDNLLISFNDVSDLFI